MKTKDKYIQAICTIVVVFLMIGASELLNEKEIIFPEVTALAVGMFLAPMLPWKTSYSRMFISITLCAILGVAIVLFIPAPLWVQMSLAYLAGQIVLILSRTSFAPMISAIVLPVMLQTKESIYIVAAITLTLLIIAIKVILDKTKIKTKENYQKKEWRVKEEWISLIKRTIIVTILIFIAIKLNNRFVVAPPLLVAFTELSNKKSKARDIPIKVIMTISLCALLGAVMRYLIVICGGWPLTLAAILAALGMIMIVMFMKVYMPPAGAMTILAMLIPNESVVLYPVQVFVGITIFVITAKLCFRKKDYH